MDAKLICYTLGKISPTKRSTFKRELNGYIDISNNSKYKYQRKGLLQEISHLTPIRSVIIIQNKDKNTLTRLLDKYKAKYHVFNVTIQPNQLKA